MSGLRTSIALQTAEERIAEIGAILALGLIRLQMPKSSQKERLAGESSLDCIAAQSGHSSPASKGGKE